MYYFSYFPILQLYFSFPTAMQVGAMAKSEDFEEDYGAVDIMSSLERDIGNLFHCIDWQSITF